MRVPRKNHKFKNIGVDLRVFFLLRICIADDSISISVRITASRGGKWSPWPLRNFENPPYVMGNFMGFFYFLH